MADNNLLGKSHKPYVQEQIKIRQEKLGKLTRDSKDIDWMNGKTSWVRLASSVNVENTSTTIAIPTTQDVNIGGGEDQTLRENISPQLNPKLLKFNLEQMGTLLDGVSYREFKNSVNGKLVGDYRLELLGLDESYMGNTLAKRLVLHGGTEQASISPDFKELKLNKLSGISEKFSPLASAGAKAYSSNNGDFGLVAMPGLESFDIKSRSMGSLREANVTLRVNDTEQFKLLETIYLRLGYSMFLEWGNSSYYNNDGDYVKGAEAEPNLLYKFLDPTYAPYLVKDPIAFIVEIEKARKASNGNYDAIFGRVKNFSWEFDPSGYYKITLDIISWGDIIESLKMDQYYSDVILDPEQPTATDRRQISTLNSFIYEAAKPTRTVTQNIWLNFDPTNKVLPPIGTNNETFEPTKSTLISDDKFIQKIWGITSNRETITKSQDYSATLNYLREITNSFEKVISGFATFGTESKPYYYIRFGDILDFIQSRLMIYVSDTENPSSIIPIDTTDNNYCFNPGINVSADPSKVMIRRKLPVGYTVYTLPEDLRLETLDAKKFWGQSKMSYDHEIFGGTLQSGKNKTLSVALEEFDTEINGVLAGNIMNIYFEKEFLYQTIDQNMDKEKGLSFTKFIKPLLEAANESLGGVNKLDFRINDEGKLQIYDQVPLYGWKSKSEEENATRFNIYGIKDIQGQTPKGSFVTNFGLKTELTNDFATLISIGAQANNKSVGEDATMLSKWNFGLIDRIYKEKYESLYKPSVGGAEKETEQLASLLKKMKDIWSRYVIQRMINDETALTNFVQAAVFSSEEATIYNFPIFPSNFSSLVKIQKDFFKEYIKFYSKQSNQLSNQIGMLPINLNLEMDGISGIRIYDQIHVDTRFLPSYYPQYLVFIIKGISHSFNGNRWVTKIDTIAQPKVQFDKVDFKEGLVVTDPQSSASNLIENADSFDGDTPNAELLRSLLVELRYGEKGNEISNGGDISFDIARAAGAIFKTISTELPNIQVTVTGGNDLYHQGLNYNSRHKRGNSIDFVITPDTNANVKSVETILQRYAKGENPFFRYLNEYNNPTKAATGKHFHISWGIGTEGQANLDSAISSPLPPLTIPQFIADPNTGILIDAIFGTVVRT
jgi:hypothetical protein